jgi:hypothetical protein
VVLLWNLRDDTDPFSKSYGSLLSEFATEPDLVGSDKYVRCGESFLARRDVGTGESRIFPHRQELDEAGLLSRALSVSFGPSEPGTVKRFEARLRELFARHQRDERVAMCYQTALYRGRPVGG